MTARKPLFVQGPGDVGVTNPAAARLALSGLVSAKGPTALDRGAGVFFGPGNPCQVTGAGGGPNMKYLIAAGPLTTQRTTATNGLYTWANDGSFQVDSATPAPGSGSRYDLIWALAADGSSAGPDANSDTSFGVAVGTASAGTPTKPTVLVPDGALVLAEALVSAGNADATAAVITQASPWKVAVGAPIPVRSATERGALTAYLGLQVMRLDKGGAIETYDGAVWAGGDTGWVTAASAGFTAAAGYSALNGNVRRKNGLVQLSLSLSTTSALGSGNITNETIINVPADYRVEGGNLGPVGGGSTGGGWTGYTQNAAIVMASTETGFGAGSTFSVLGLYML